LSENVYEGMYIFDSGRYARDAAGVTSRVEKMVKGAGGELLVSRLWEERRLAYPIKGNRKGTYWLTYFRADTQTLTDMNRQCQISEDILRHLYVKVDERIVDAVVSHALGRVSSESPKDVSDTPVDRDLDDDDDDAEDEQSEEELASAGEAE